ncbi:hypothetical protein OSTOST_01793, partial [Ostertagia ostertagi]
MKFIAEFGFEYQISPGWISLCLQIGALFPVHRQIAGSESCGQIWEQYGIQRTEIALRTVRELQDQLPFRLGISVRDSCWTERIAMEQTIAFLREGVAQCSCCQTPGCNKKSVAGGRHCRSRQELSDDSRPKSYPGGRGRKCRESMWPPAPPRAVRGLAESARNGGSESLKSVTRRHTDLSTNEQFGVVPSDVWQAQAINRLLHHYNWTYIAVLYSA